MDHIDWLRSHVERCLQDIWELPRVHADPDGDYPYRQNTAACFVRVEDGEPAFVRVWAHAAFGLKPTAKLLAEINEVNSRTRTAHVFLAKEGRVVVEQVLHAEGVGRGPMGQACAAVGAVASDIGPMIATVFGGQTPFPVELDIDEEAS